MCRDGELIHPRDMRRDPFFFNWNFSWTWDCFAAGGQGLRTLVKVIVFKLIHPSESPGP